MRRLTVALPVLVLLFLAACGQQVDTEKPPKIIYGQDVCDRCGMIVNEENFAAAYWTKTGEARRFDDIGGMLAYMNEESEEVASYWVHDFASGEWIRAEEANADLNLAKLAQQKQDLVNEIALQVKTAVAQLDAARNEVKVANLGVALAQEEVSQARDRFQAGVANNIEVTSAQDALARANNNQIGALYSYNEARANLARATGQIEDLYAK